MPRRSSLSRAYPVDVDGDLYFVFLGWWPLEQASSFECKTSGHKAPQPGKWVSVDPSTQLEASLCTNCAGALVLNHGIGR